MHFKLDLKEKKMFFFKESDFYFALFCCFWRTGCFFLKHFMDRRLEKCFREANLECL